MKREGETQSRRGLLLFAGTKNINTEERRSVTNTLTSLQMCNIHRESWSSVVLDLTYRKGIETRPAE